LKAALQDAAGTPLAKDAETALYELDNLGYGQPAPAFASRARDGSQVALADFRGRVVLLVFWAST
jgi:cytochrome oxidase Cu insertion factor (SCO1/SenC/PrrC family)